MHQFLQMSSCCVAPIVIRQGNRHRHRTFYRKFVAHKFLTRPTLSIYNTLADLIYDCKTRLEEENYTE